MTQMLNALRAAGFVPTAERLRDIAVGVLAIHASSREAAAEALYARVRHEADLLEELFKPYRDLALKRLLGAIEAEMRKYELAEQGRGSSHAVSQRAHASPHDAGHSYVGDHGGTAQHQNVHGHGNGVPHLESARDAQERVGAVLRLTMLDTFKIDGTSIGDVQAGVARAWARREGRHVRWVMLLTANMPPQDPVRRWITPDEADALWQRSLGDDDA